MTSKPVSSIFAAVLLTGLLGGCAPMGTTEMAAQQQASQSLASQCFTTSQIQNFQNADGRLFLRAKVSGVYEVALGGCSTLDLSQALKIEPESIALSDQLCPGDRAELTPLGRSTLPVTCRVSLGPRLTPAEVAALPDRYRP